MIFLFLLSIVFAWWFTTVMSVKAIQGQAIPAAGFICWGCTIAFFVWCVLTLWDLWPSGA